MTDREIKNLPASIHQRRRPVGNIAATSSPRGSYGNAGSSPRTIAMLPSTPQDARKTSSGRE